MTSFAIVLVEAISIVPLDKSFSKTLRGRAHDLHPVVRIGQAGLTDNLFREIDRALSDHELIKVSIRIGDRAVRDEAITAICQGTGADRVDRIGNTAVLYRPRPQGEL